MNSTYDDMTRALRDEGLKAALAVLNAHVPQRFSAVYCLVEGQLMNIAFVDKQGEPLPQELMSVRDTADTEFCATKDTPALHFAVPLVLRHAARHDLPLRHGRTTSGQRGLRTSAPGRVRFS